MIEASVIATEAKNELLTRLDWMILQPERIVEMNYHPITMGDELKKRYSQAQLMTLHHSEQILTYLQAQASKQQLICADISIPVANHSIDLLILNFLFPWQRDHRLLFKECRRVLRPNGLLMFTALGLGTLEEYHTVLGDMFLPQLIDMHDIGDLLLSEKFADPVLDVNHYTVTYRSLDRLSRELYLSGMVASPLASTKHSCFTKKDDCFSLHYEVVYAHAFLPTQAPAEEGVVKIPLSHLRKK